MWSRRIVTVLAGVLTAASSIASPIDEQEVRGAARAFIERIAPDMASELTPSLKIDYEPGGLSDWSIHAGRFSVYLDKDGEVVDFSNSKLYGRANLGPESQGTAKSGRPFYASEQDLVGKAKTILDSLGWHHGPEVEYRLPRPDRAGDIPRSILYVEFHDRPYGFPTHGNGNMTVIALDSLTGEVIEMQRFIGYSYEPGPVNVSREQAVATAARSIELPPTPDVRGPQYQVLSERYGATEAASGLIASKTCPLVYTVQGVTEVAWVDAVSGRLLEHFDNATSGYTPKSARSPAARDSASAAASPSRRPARSPWIWELPAGAFLAGLALLLLKRARLR